MHRIGLDCLFIYTIQQSKQKNIVSFFSKINFMLTDSIIMTINKKNKEN